MLATLGSLIAQYGYVVVGIGCFVEGEIAVFAGMIAAQEGILSPYGVAVAAVVGTFIGDNLWFQLGRMIGRPALMRRPGWHAKAARVEYLLDRYGALVMIAFRFFYGLRYVTPFVLASLGIPTWRFVACDLIGTLIWATVVSVAGYYLAEAARQALDQIQHAEIGLASVLVAVAIIAAGIYYWRRRRRQRQR